MKGLAKGLAFGSAFFVLASADIVKADEIKVHCDEPKCTERVYLGPNDGNTYIAWCDGGYAATQMICHKAKGITCGKAKTKDGQLECLCDNWDPKTRDTTIDIWCSR